MAGTSRHSKSLEGKLEGELVHLCCQHGMFQDIILSFRAPFTTVAVNHLLCKELLSIKLQSVTCM